MKALTIVGLLAAAVLFADAQSSQYGSWYNGPFKTLSDLNATNICGANNLIDRTLLFSNTSGWNYQAIGCGVGDNQLLNVTANLPLLLVDVPVVPVGFELKQATVGVGSTVFVNGPRSILASMSMPWFVEIKGNTFRKNAHLRVTGSFPINSTVVIAQNSFQVEDENAFMVDTLGRLVAIGIGGMSDESMVLYHDSFMIIENNNIKIDATMVPKKGAAIGLLADQYFTDNTRFTIRENSINAVCSIYYECSGIDTVHYLTMTEEYVNASTRIHHNNFTITNGKAFVVPRVWAPNATFYLSADHNTATLETKNGGSEAGVSEHAITLEATAAGFNTAVHVVHNHIVSTRGNAIFFFSSALDMTGNSIFNLSHNVLRTTAGDPSVYFVDQFSLIGRATLNIDNNIFKREDDITVKRPYVSLTYDFSVLGYSEFSFRNNECFPKNIQSGPRMVILSDNRVANVGPTAFFAICKNIYNGNPADLISQQILFSNILRLVNCNPRDAPTTVPTTASTTTAGGRTTTSAALTTTAGPQVNSAHCVTSKGAFAVAAAAFMVLFGNIFS